MDQSTLSHYYPWKADEPQPTRNQRPAEEGLQWGSDPSFCYHGYSSPIGTWTEERLVQNLMRNMAKTYTGATGIEWIYNAYIPVLNCPTKRKTLRNAILSTFIFALFILTIFILAIIVLTTFVFTIFILIDPRPNSLFRQL
ncbi:hypothetical protein PENVUL_c034G07079 [Penicillium vulpinum]|uniref:Uncharacterized protein n=1 Tax=Penicillium vulpinum TaxID=29845 RepID=A0A1V6RRA3_9EURO|nr:hypothetical protein PENVUL_c034G07079 [Penicillium vulpinum]